MNFSLLPDSLLGGGGVAPLARRASVSFLETPPTVCPSAPSPAVPAPRVRPSPSARQARESPARESDHDPPARPTAVADEDGSTHRPPRPPVGVSQGCGGRTGGDGAQSRPCPPSPSPQPRAPSPSRPARVCACSLPTPAGLTARLTFSDVRELQDALAARDRTEAGDSEGSSSAVDEDDTDEEELLPALEGDYVWAHRFIAEAAVDELYRDGQWPVHMARPTGPPPSSRAAAPAPQPPMMGQEWMMGGPAPSWTPSRSVTFSPSPLPAHTDARVSPPPPPPPRHGRQTPQGSPPMWCLDDFDIVRKIGQGRFGKLYLAHERRTRAVVVLKCLSKELILLNDLFRQVRSEVELQYLVSRCGPYILPLHGYFWDEVRVVLVLGYAEAGSLADRLAAVQHGAGGERALGLPMEEVRAAVAQVAAALAFLHAHGIAHGDVKPDNVLRTRDARTGRTEVRLADFSCATRLTGPNPWRCRGACGTLDYQAPEQVAGGIAGGGSPSRKADVWSLGAMTFELLCGHAPFAHVDASNVRASIAAGVVTYPPSLPTAAREFLERLLCVDARVRLSAAEVLAHPFLHPGTDTEAWASGPRSVATGVGSSARVPAHPLDLSPLAFPSLWPLPSSPAAAGVVEGGASSPDSAATSALTATGAPGPGAADVSIASDPAGEATTEPLSTRVRCPPPPCGHRGGPQASRLAPAAGLTCGGALVSAANTSVESRLGRRSSTPLVSEVSISSMSLTCRPSPLWEAAAPPPRTAARGDAWGGRVVETAEADGTLNISALTVLSAEESVSVAGSASVSGEVSPSPLRPTVDTESGAEAYGSGTAENVDDAVFHGARVATARPVHVRVHATRTRGAGAAGVGPPRDAAREALKSPGPAAASPPASEGRSGSAYGVSQSLRRSGSSPAAGGRAVGDDGSGHAQASCEPARRCVQRLSFDEGEGEQEGDEEEGMVVMAAVPGGAAMADPRARRRGDDEGQHRVVWSTARPAASTAGCVQRAGGPCAAAAPIVAQRRRDPVARDLLDAFLSPHVEVGPTW